MKTEELREKGLTDEQIAFVMAEHGKDINSKKKELEDMTAERDRWQTSAETAETTLKSFDGVDIKKLNDDINDYKKRIDEIENEYKNKLAERDFNDSLSEAIRSKKGRNERAIKALLDINALRESKNQKEDISAALDALIKAEDSSMLFDVATEAEQKKAKFTGKSESGTVGTEVTKDSIMAIKDRTERRRMIAKHMELFQ